MDQPHPETLVSGWGLFYVETSRLILPTAADKSFIISSFLNRTILNLISRNTFSRRSSFSFCKSWISSSTSITNPALSKTLCDLYGVTVKSPSPNPSQIQWIWGGGPKVGWGENGLPAYLPAEDPRRGQFLPHASQFSRREPCRGGAPWRIEVLPNTSTALCSYLHRRHVRCTIAHRSIERRRGSFDKQHYRKRIIVERLINRLKQFRRIATRYEKRAANFAALVTIASVFFFSYFAYRL